MSSDPTSQQALWGKGLVLHESLGRTAEAVRTWEALLLQDLSPQDREHVLSVVAEARQRLADRPVPAAGSTR